MRSGSAVLVRSLGSVPATYRGLRGTVVETGTAYVTRSAVAGWWVELEDGRVVWLRETEIEECAP